MKQMTFVKACHVCFGRKLGQSLKDFGDELKALSPKDRDDLTREFLAVGIEIVKE